MTSAFVGRGVLTVSSRSTFHAGLMHDEWWAGWRTTVAICLAAAFLTLLLLITIDWVPHR
jgi:hypothetical protein